MDGRSCSVSSCESSPGGSAPALACSEEAMISIRAGVEKGRFPNIPGLRSHVSAHHQRMPAPEIRASDTSEASAIATRVIVDFTVSTSEWEMGSDRECPDGLAR